MTTEAAPMEVDETNEPLPKEPARDPNFVWEEDHIRILAEKGFLDKFDPTMTKAGDRIAIFWNNHWWPCTCDNVDKAAGKWFITFDSEPTNSVPYEFTQDNEVHLIHFIEAAIEEEEALFMSSKSKKKRTKKKKKATDDYDLEQDMKNMDMSDDEDYESDDASESSDKSESESEDDASSDESSDATKAKTFVNPKKRGAKKEKSALASMAGLGGNVDAENAKAKEGKCRCISDCPRKANTSGMYVQSIEIGKFHWNLPSVNLQPIKYPDYSFVFENVEGHYATTSIELKKLKDGTMCPEFTELQFANLQRNDSSRELYYVIYDSPCLYRCVISYSSIKAIHRGYRLGGRCFCIETTEACEWEQWSKGYGWTEMEDPTDGESSTNGLHILTFAKMPRYVQQLLSRMVVHLKRHKFKVAVNQLEYDNAECESIFPKVTLKAKKGKSRKVKKGAPSKSGAL